MTTDSKNLIEEIIENAVSQPISPEADSSPTPNEKQKGKSAAEINENLKSTKIPQGKRHQGDFK